jgi:hypothetical protein
MKAVFATVATIAAAATVFMSLESLRFVRRRALSTLARALPAHAAASLLLALQVRLRRLIAALSTGLSIELTVCRQDRLRVRALMILRGLPPLGILPSGEVDLPTFRAYCAHVIRVFEGSPRCMVR